MKKTFYVTTAIDYVNDKPHIGHSYQKILADVLARWYKQDGRDVFFLTGTDEHGQKLADSAEKSKLSPKKFVDKMSKFFKLAWDALNIDYERFIRTTDKDHEKASKEFIKKLYKQGDIYLGKYSGSYCRRCEAYVTEKDLVNGKCPFHLTEPETVTEECYFFKLSKYQDALLDYYEQNQKFILPEGRRQEIINRVQDGLKDLAISRTSFSWGIPFPIGKGHVTYVWFEALLNYITGIGWNKNLKKFKKFWPADVHLLGKDNAWFHTVIWPAMLIAAGIEPPKTVYIHGFVNLRGQKISKSLGNVIDPVAIVKKYGSDAYRYFFCRELSPREDGIYSEEALVERYNGELANEFGNLVSRVVSMINKYYKGKIPPGKVTLKAKVPQEQIDNFDVNRAVEDIWVFIREVNKYIQDNQPWELAKTDKKKLDDVLYNASCAIRDIIALVYPFIPLGAEKAAKQLGLKKVPKFSDIGKSVKGKVKVGDPIYPRIEYVAEAKKFNLDIRPGKIISITEIPNSEKLYKLQVDFNGEKRQVVAGLKKYFSSSELDKNEFIFICNLEVAKLAGERSEAMILAVEDEGKIDLLKPTGKIELEGYDISPAKVLKLKDFLDWKLKVVDGKVVVGDSILKGVASKFKKGKVA